jgi:hypothetical protein
LRAKSDAFSTFLHFFAWVSTQFGVYHQGRPV